MCHLCQQDSVLSTFFFSCLLKLCCHAECFILRKYESCFCYSGSSGDERPCTLHMMMMMTTQMHSYWCHSMQSVSKPGVTCRPRGEIQSYHTMACCLHGPVCCTLAAPSHEQVHCRGCLTRLRAAAREAISASSSAGHYPCSCWHSALVKALLVQGQKQQGQSKAMTAAPWRQ